MSSPRTAIALVLAAAAAVLGAQAASADSRPQPSPLVAYSCDGWGPSLVVWRDQSALLTTSGPRDERIDRTFRLRAQTYRRLTAALAHARFRTLRRVYAPRRPLPMRLDRCALSYRGRTVVVHQGAVPPDRLERVLRILDAIVRANARR
jgi:hypothetical protein